MINIIEDRVAISPVARLAATARRREDPVTAHSARIGPDDLDLHARFETFAAAFRGVFQRSDQFLRFRAYLRGLLGPGERKNIEGLAQTATAAMTVESNLVQSLQHFVSTSPWDSNRLLARVRAETQPWRRDKHSVWVVHDGAFAKKGTQSVGVQRQFARSEGRKLNCQIAVAISQVGPGGYYPLAARLYLPAHWLREKEDVAEKTVPEEFRRNASKSDIALELIDELVATETVRPVIAESGYAGLEAFVEGLNQRHLTFQTEPSRAIEEAVRGFDALKTSLGLDHFEGRTWQGWHHHVAMVFTAHYFLAQNGLAPRATVETLVPQ